MTLRAVTADDRPQKAKPATLKAAAEASERELLVKMRDDISDAVAAGVPPHTLAPLMRQIREIDKEIRSLDARTQQDSGNSAKPVDNTYNSAAV